MTVTADASAAAHMKAILTPTSVTGVVKLVTVGSVEVQSVAEPKLSMVTKAVAAAGALGSLASAASVATEAAVADVATMAGVAASSIASSSTVSSSGHAAAPSPPTLNLDGGDDGQKQSDEPGGLQPWKLGIIFSAVSLFACVLAVVVYAFWRRGAGGRKGSMGPDAALTFAQASKKEPETGPYPDVPKIPIIVVSNAQHHSGEI